MAAPFSSSPYRALSSYRAPTTYRPVSGGSSYQPTASTSSPAMAAVLERRQRLIGQAEQQQTARREPEEEESRGLWEQVGDFFNPVNVAVGIGGLVGEVAESAVALPRLAIDLIKDQDLKRDEQFSGLQSYLSHYAPAVNTVGGSIYKTGYRVSHPAEYLKAIEEGRIVEAIGEDVGNLAILGGPVAKVLGRTGIAVNVAAKEAPFVAGRTALKSVGASAAPMSVAEAIRPIMRTTSRERSLLSRLSEVTPATESRVVNLPGRGLAGLAERAGYGGVAQGLERAAGVTRTVSQLGEKAGNAPAGVYTVPLKYGNRAVRALTGKDIAAGTVRRVGEGVEKLGARGGVLFPFTEQGRQVNKIIAVTQRAGINIQRIVNEPARLADQLGLTDSAARAALFAVDERMYPTIAMLREMGDRFDDASVDELIKRMYVEPDGTVVDPKYRPTAADVRTLLDYTEGRLDETTRRSIDQVAEAMGDVAVQRKNALLAEVDPNTGRPLLDPAQLEQELLPGVVSKYQATQERPRNRTQRQWEKEFPGMVRTGLVATAYDMLAAELPEPPRVDQITAAGVNAGRVLGAARSRYDTAVRDLAAAVDQYEQLSEKGPAPRLQEAERRVARLTSRVSELRNDYDRVVRREDAATGLSRASGEVQEVPGVQRPTADLSKAETVTRLRARAREIGQEEAGAVLGEVDNLVGTNRPTLPPNPFADQTPAGLGGEWDWWYQLPVKTRRAMQREGWMGGRKGRRIAALEPDQFIEILNDRLGRELSIDDGMAMFVEMFERYTGAKGGRSIPVLERLAQESNIGFDAAVQAVRGKLSDYADALADPINRDVDALRDAYVEMTDDERQSFDLTVNAVLADPDVGVDFDAGDVLQEFFPEIDVTGSQGVLATFGDRVSLPEVIEFMRTGEQPATMRAVLARRTPAQYRQLGRLAGERGGAAALVREASTERRAAIRDLAAAQREADRKLSAAGKAVDNAADVEAGRRAGLEQSEGVVRALPPGVAAYERGPRGALSPAEVLRQRQGAAHQAHRHQVAKVARLERAMAYRNEKIGDMRSELSRGFVDRLVTDVNRPMITRFRNIVRKGGDPLGQLRGRAGQRRLDGVLGALSRKHGFYDRLLLELERVERPRTLAAVDDIADVDVRPGFAEQAAVIFEELAHEHGVVLDVTDAQRFTDSVATDSLLETLSTRTLADAQQGLAPNTPFRLRELIDTGIRDLPDDVKSQFENAWVDYGRRRGNLLNRNMDKYAEAMPGRYRSIAMTARRQIRTLLEMAEERNRVRAGTGDVYIDAATSTMDTLAELVEAGVDPTHLTGGADVKYPFTPGFQGRGRMNVPKVRAQSQLRHGLRALDPAAQARLEADQLAKVLHRRQIDAITKPITEGGFGRRADDVLRDQIAQHYDNTGEAMSPDQLRDAAEAAGWASMEPRGAVNPQTMLIPEAIRKNTQDYAFTKGTAWQLLRTSNQKWKSWVLPLSTRWLTGNLFGNAISAYAYAGITPLELVRTMREISKMEGGRREIWDRSGLPDWVPDQLASHGLGWRDYKIMFEPEDTKVARTRIGRLIERSYKLNETTDNLTRSAVYLSKLRDGIPSDGAMNVALNALGDFTRMSRFERSVLKEVIPFYPWLRHQTQATMRLPIEHPARAMFLLHLGDLYSDPEENDGLMGLIGSAVPLGGGKFFDVGSISPFAEMDPFKMPFSPTAIGRSISPFLRLPTALLTGLDVSRMQQLTRPAGTQRRGAYGQEEATPPLLQLLRGNPLQALGEVGYVASQQLAPSQLRSLRDIALGPNARYGTGYEIGTDSGRYIPAQRGPILNQLARVAGIPSIRTIDLVEARRRAAEQERRQRG